MPRLKKLEELSGDRANVTLALTGRANAAITAWVSRFGGAKQIIVQRLIEFFAAAPESVQQMMVSEIPSDMREEYIKRAAEYFALLARTPEQSQLKIDPPHRITNEEKRKAGEEALRNSKAESERKKHATHHQAKDGNE